MSRQPAEGNRLTDRQRLNWLRLIRTDNVGPATFRDLINRFGSAEAAIAALPSLAASGGSLRALNVCSAERAEAELDHAQNCGAHFVAIGEPDYPPMLRRMDAPPPLIAIRGDASVFSKPAVAVVGSRNASTNGMIFARKIANELGREGFAIISGLARGIDTAAHQGSLATGTVAVLAGGLDMPYPPENASLADTICDRGAILSEMPFGWEPRARDFPRRNRLVAGLCIGLVVVEAAQRSGSLISARLASEMGRLVFAVPGSPMDPRAAGTNGLLRDGATMVTSVQDILDELAPILEGKLPLPAPAPTEGAKESEPELAYTSPPPQDSRELVLEALSPTPVAIDDIARHTGLHPSQLMMILLELDLAGRLERHVGGAVSLLVHDV